MMMQGSVAITPSPVIMESMVFRQKLGLSLSSTTNSVLHPSSLQSFSTARCLFGAPDPVQAKDLVREVELKNALSFGKRFNFDIVNGHPFPAPAAKRMKMEEVEVDHSDEENQDQEVEEGYAWTESYDENFMASCNKHAMRTSVVGPNNRHPVCLFYAPIIPVPSSPSPVPSPACSRVQVPKSEPKSTSGEEAEPSQKVESETSSPVSSSSSVISVPRLSPEHNNENNNNNEPKKNFEKTKNRINRLHHQDNHHPTSGKRTSFSSLTKYTNRVLKHAVMKKPRKSIITDFLQMRRVGRVAKPNSKK